MMENDKKKCPYCGEEIMAVAKKCRHCGEWLDKSDATSRQPRTSQTHKSKNDNNPVLKYSVLGIVVILIVAFTYVIASKSDNEEASGQAASEIEEIDTVSVEEEPTVDTKDLLSLQSLMDLCWKKPNEIISYLKSKGLKVKGNDDYMYYCKLPNVGWINIFAKPMGDRMGIGPVEFTTTSRSQYNEWKRQLKAANYHQEDGDMWCGDTGHYFTFRLVDLLDAPVLSDGDEGECDYSGTAALCVSAYPSGL